MTDVLPLLRKRWAGKHRVNRSVTDPAKFLFFEVFTDEAAFEAHQHTPRFKQMILEEALPRLAQRERVQYVPL